MGHSLVGELPATLKWKQVIALIASGATVPEISSASTDAAERSLADAGEDEAVQHSVWLLAQVPLAADMWNFTEALENLGLRVGPDPSLVDICAAFTEAVDAHVGANGRRTDLGEMAQLSAVESLMAIAGRQTADLFGPRNAAEEVRKSLKGLGTVKQFGVLAHDFLARLTRRYLDYYLGRELPQHVGVNRRFHSIREHQQFDEALTRHCREAAMIAQQFAGEWFSKAKYESVITPERAGGFARFAFEKIRNELRRRQYEHA